MPKKAKPKKSKSDPCKRLQANARVRNAEGKLTGKDGLTSLERWNSPGALGFARFIADTQPHIKHADGRYRPVKLTRRQVDIVKQVLAVDADGDFLHQMSIIQGPRRMGKSVLILLILIWLTCSRKNHVTQLLGANEFHSRKTAYQPIVDIIEHSQKLRLLFGPIDRNIKINEVRNSKTRSIIQMMPGMSFSSSFGQNLQCLYAGDLHSYSDYSPWNSIQASLIDSHNSLVFADSQPDAFGGPVEALEKQSTVDDSIYFHSITYDGWEDYEANAPSWIDRRRALRLRDSLLEAEVKRDLYGQRSSIVNSLFPEPVIELCKDSYRYPVEDIKALIGDRAHVIGGGLDRADSEWGSVFGNDNSVFVSVAKVASPDNGEPEFFVLDAHLFRPSTGRAIKRHILEQHKKYGFKNVTLEAHSCQDVHQWCVEQKIPTTLESPTSTLQNVIFPELVRIAKTGRLHISTQCTDLLGEMASMVYSRLSTGKYRFETPQARGHDDFVFALAHAVYSLRNQILQLYQLPNVVCKLKSNRRAMCFLMGGNLELLCGKQCEAFLQVEEFHRQYMQFATESHLTLAEFFNAYVTIKGAKVYQAA